MAISWKKLKSRNSEITVAILFFGIFWYFLFLHKALWSSGFHLMDDHNYIEINHQLNQGKSILEITQEYIRTDLRDSRFRPLYQLMWVVEIKFLGANYNNHLLLRIIYLLISSVLLYYFARSKSLNFTIPFAIGFVLLIFWGDQLRIYYLFGSGESRSLFWATIGFYGLGKAHEAEIKSKKRNFYYFLAYTFCFIASLCKESFITFIPAFIAIDVFLYKQQQQSKNWLEVLYQNWIKLAIVVSLMMCYAVLLLKYIGTAYGPQDYKKLPLFKVMLERFCELLATNNYGLAIFFVLFSFLMSLFVLRAEIKQPFSKNIVLVLEMLAILISCLLLQVYVYRGYGFGDNRYLIPSTLYISFFSFYIANTYYQTIRNLNIKKTFKFATGGAFIAVWGIALVQMNPKVNMTAFAALGKGTKDLFEIMKKYTKDSSPIVVIFDASNHTAPEDIFAIERFIKYQYKMNNSLYFQTVLVDSSYYKALDSDLKAYIGGFINRKKQEHKVLDTIRTSLKNVLVYDDCDAIFQEKNKQWFDIKKYKKNQARGFTYYTLEK